jgi:hypothetical protein
MDTPGVSDINNKPAATLLNSVRFMAFTSFPDKNTLSRAPAGKHPIGHCKPTDARPDMAGIKGSGWPRLLDGKLYSFLFCSVVADRSDADRRECFRSDQWIYFAS